jgi:tRNA 2-thiouridine synthesizing protein A
LIILLNEGVLVLDNIKPDKTLDAKGLECPMPLLKAKKEIDAMENGQVLEIIGTDEGSKVDLPGWCDRVGHSYLGVKEEANFFKFYIKKGG